MRISLRRALAGATAAVLGTALGLVAVTGAELATAPAASAAVGDGDAYFFPYFTGESTADGETVRFAVSTGNTPSGWTELNSGRPVLTSTLGTRGLRDPFILRKADGSGFVLLATDLTIHGGGNFGDAQETGSRAMMVWESTDLVSWGSQRSVTLAPATAGNLWAPEAFWDASRGRYVVYWASALYGSTSGRDINASYQRMMYATTTDFRTFSTPQPWIDMRRGAGKGMIDSTVAKVGSTFYRFTKDEGSMTVRQESSTDLLRTQGVTSGDGWALVAERLGVGQANPWGGTFTQGEGPSVFPSLTDNTWYLVQDQPSYHGGQGYMLFQTTNIASGSWTSVPSAQLPTSPRHGTILPITAAEKARLLAAYPPAPTGGGPVVGQWYHVRSAHSGLVMGIAGGSTATGAEVVQLTRSAGATNQQVRFLDSGGGYYRLQLRHSNQVVDLWNRDTANGAKVAQYTDVNGTNQQFLVRRNTDGTYTFVNRLSGKALDLYDWATTSGARISQYTDNGYAVQKWHLDAAS